jgi:hypothetical protein
MPPSGQSRNRHLRADQRPFRPDVPGAELGQAALQAGGVAGVQVDSDHSAPHLDQGVARAESTLDELF